MGKVTGCDRPGKDLTGNPHHGRAQTHKKRRNEEDKRFKKTVDNHP